MPKTKEKSPAFQFYPKDWLTDINIIMMEPEERGLYIWALCHDWLEDGLTEEQLTRLCKYSKGTSTLVQERFVPHPTKLGKFTNRRLLKERQNQAEWSDKCRKGGINSGKSRASALKGSSQIVPTKPEVKGNTSSSSSSSSSISKNPLTPFKGEVKFPESISTPQGKEAWAKWLDYKKCRKESYKSVESQNAQLKRWASKTSAQFAAAIDYSMGQNWAGIHEERKSHSNGSSIGQSGFSEAFEHNMKIRDRLVEAEKGEKS